MSAPTRPGEGLLQGRDREGPPRDPPGRPGDRPRGPAGGQTTYAAAGPRAPAAMAAEPGPSIGAYAAAMLDHPLPWTKMRQVYALLGLVKKWGPGASSRLRAGPRGRGGERQPHRPDARRGPPRTSDLPTPAGCRSPRRRPGDTGRVSSPRGPRARRAHDPRRPDGGAA